MAGLAAAGERANRNASPFCASAGRKIQQSRPSRPAQALSAGLVGGSPFPGATQPQASPTLLHSATRSGACYAPSPRSVALLQSVRFRHPPEDRPVKRLLLPACCLLTCAAVALAPPVPKPKNDFGGGWDRPIDPTKKCKFTFTDKDTLVVEAPAGRYDLVPNNEYGGGPRLLRTVKGDFTAVVRVRGDFAPAG